MDFRRPVQAVVPGAHGRVLGVLAGVSTELNMRTIARLSGVSLAQASRVLPAMVEQGLVERRDVGTSAMFRLVEEHVAVRAVLAIAQARQFVLEELGATAKTLDPAPASVVVFGSFARGDAGPGSDVDVVVVRPHGVDEDDEAWASGLERWRQRAGRLTGNAVELVVLGQSEVAGLLRSGRPLWDQVRRDGIVVAGRPLAEL